MAIQYKIEIEKFDSSWFDSFARSLPNLVRVEADDTFIFQKDKSESAPGAVIKPTSSGVTLTIYDFEFGRTLIGLLVELITGEKGKLSIDEV